MTWNELSGRPPSAFNATMLWSPQHEQLLMAALSEASTLELWGMEETGWNRLESNLLPAPTPEDHSWIRPLAWIDDEGELWLARLFPRGILVGKLGSKPKFQKRKLPDSIHGYTPFACWNAEAGHALIGLPDDGKTRFFSVRDGVVQKYAEGPQLGIIAAGPDGVLGARIDHIGGWHTKIVALRSNEWVELGRHPGMMQGLAWDPRVHGFVGFFPKNDQTMVLHVWKGDRFRKRPLVTMRFVNGHGLAVTASGRHVFFGGQDFDAGGAHSNTTWRNGPLGRDALQQVSSAVPKLGRYATAITTDRLLLASHGACSVTTPEDDAWSTVVPAVPLPERDAAFERFDDRFENFAAYGDTFWMLDAKGGLWRASAGSPWSLVDVEGDDGPTGYYSHRVAMAWDAIGERLILQGGSKDEGWSYDPKENHWVELEGTRPKRGYGPAVSTPEGVFALIGRRLWHLGPEGWTQVGKKTIDGGVLLYDPKRQRLLVESYAELSEITEEGVQRSVHEGSRALGSTPELIGLDPVSDHIVVFARGGSGAATLSLAELDLGNGLPTPRAEKATKKPTKKTKKTKKPTKEATKKATKKATRKKARSPEKLPALDEQLATIVERLRTTSMAEDEEDDDWYRAIRWEDTPFEKLEAARKTRVKKLDAYEKKHAPIPPGLRAFIERWGMPRIEGTVYGTQMQMRVSLAEWDLLRAGKTSYTLRFDMPLTVRGEPAPKGIAFWDKTYSAIMPLPICGDGSLGWVGFGLDTAYPKGLRLAPVGATFDDVIIGTALGLVDAIFRSPDRSRTQLDKRIGRELDDTLRAIAIAWLDRYEAFVKDNALDTQEGTYHLDEIIEDTHRGASAIVLLASEVPGAEKAAKKAKRPEIASFPFVWHGGQKKIQNALETLPDDYEYDAASKKAGKAVGKVLFDYLVAHGGCPTHYTWWPDCTKDQVVEVLEKKKIRVQQLRNGTTDELYTLAVGARAALERTAALRTLLT